MLSRIVPLRRRDGRCWRRAPAEARIIMSATLRTEDFVENRRSISAMLLRSSMYPPVNIPVTLHFSKRTELYDYTGATFAKVCDWIRNTWKPLECLVKHQLSSDFLAADQSTFNPVFPERASVHGSPSYLH